jgi:hypothetical protein
MFASEQPQTTQPISFFGKLEKREAISLKMSSKSTKPKCSKNEIQSHTSPGFTRHRHANHLIGSPPCRQSQEVLPLLLLVVVVVILVVESMVDMVVLVVMVVVRSLRNRGG